MVAFPTETVYGLGAHALDRAAVIRIYEAKGRPATSPLIVHTESLAKARALASAWPGEADALAQQFWPGPLTLVLPKAPAIPDEVSAGLPTVGLRVPAHPVALQLLQAAGFPLAAPSANRFTQLSPATAQHVWESLGDAVDMILDGGPANIGIESTVLSLADSRMPAILRPGGVTRAQIEAVIGHVDSIAEVGPNLAHPSPGMHQKHYSPRTPLAIGNEIPYGRVAYIWWSAEKTQAHTSQQMPAEAAGYAARLYTVLHELDTQQLSLIVVEPVPETQEWDGVRDRLDRAAFRS